MATQSQFTYAGVPLLLPDPGGKLSRWLARNLPIDQIRLFGQYPTWRTSDRWASRTGCQFPGGISLINWPERPALDINTLYIPTGASRWSCGLFLADGDSLLQMNLQRVQRSVFEIWVEPEELDSLKRKVGAYLEQTDLFDLFPLDRRDPERRIRWQQPPPGRDAVVLL